MEQDTFVGTWRLVTFEARTTDGRILHPAGAEPTGRLTYDALGNMAVQIMESPRQRFSASDKSLGSAEEMQAAFKTYEAYFGTYRVNGQEGTVTHRLEGALFPNWTGTQLTRRFRFSGDLLTLSTPAMAYGGGTLTATLVWERMGQSTDV